MNEEYLPGTDEQAEPEQTEALTTVAPRPITALAARDAGIANYLASAYAKAGTLQLTPDEIKGLKADFPDDAFVTGAAGKDSLIYIEAPHLRNRMDEVLGMGAWSHVALRTWNEDYKTGKGNDAVRVYHECVLIVRGVYICQAIGDMSYYPGNPEMNYGDAFQGSQSHSLRRCLRDFGVGLQAWSKTFQKGWFERQRNAGKSQPPPTPPPAAAPPAKPKAPAKAEASKVATANTRAYVLDLLGATEEGEARANLTGYLRAVAWLDVDKECEQWPYRFVPITKEEIEALKVALGEFASNGTVVKAYQPHGMDPAQLQSQPVKEVKPEKKSEWANFLMPFGKDKGTPLGKIPVEKLKYYCETFTVRESMTVQQPDGSELVTPYAPEIVKQQKDLRAALDVAAKELGFNKA